MASNADTLMASFRQTASTGTLPETALIELGKVVSNAQNVEFYIVRLLGELVGCDLASAIVCFWGLPAKTKRETVESLVYQRFLPTDPRLHKISSAMATFKTVSEDRNRIVHALWSEDGGTWTRVFLSSNAELTDAFLGGRPERRSKTQSLQDRFTYTIKDMQDVRERLKLLANEIEGIIAIPVRRGEWRSHAPRK